MIFLILNSIFLGSNFDKHKVSIFMPTTSNRLCSNVLSTIACGINRQTVLPDRVVIGIQDRNPPDKKCIDAVKEKSFSNVHLNFVYGHPSPGNSRNKALSLMESSESVLFFDDDDCANSQAVEYSYYLLNKYSHDVFIFNYKLGLWDISSKSPFCPVNFTTMKISTDVGIGDNPPVHALINEKEQWIHNGYPLFSRRPYGIYNTQMRGEDSHILNNNFLMGDHCYTRHFLC